MKILGIETSCDDTAAAVIEDGSIIHSNVVLSQDKIHAKFGGIVPETAARQHFTTIFPVISQSLEISGIELEHLDAVAVTNGPGLAGSLIVGVNAAKGLALGNALPFVGVNHLEGHIYAAWLEGSNPGKDPGFPIICLITSGGHTDLIFMEGHGRFTLIGRTRDDAAGEAFDKAARVLGLGFPGGPAIQHISESSIGEKDRFPRPRVKNSMDFSFSGLKTALVRRAEKKGIYPQISKENFNSGQVADMASDFQEAVVDCLVNQTVEVAKQFKVKGILLGGGVASNKLLRDEMVKRSPVKVVMPKPKFCTDNAAMIGAAAYFDLRNGFRHEWDLDVIPSLKLG